MKDWLCINCKLQILHTGIKNIVRNKKEMRRKTLEKIREQGGASSKLFWSDLGKRKRKRRSIPRLKSKIGQVVESQEEVVEELAKHWEELGSRKESESTMEEDRMEGSEVRSDLCEMVTFDEVVGILKQLKRGKATGPDGIPNEMMMYGGTRMVVTMVQLFNLVVQQACCPKDWRRSYIVPLYKDGDPETASNYRGIALGSCVAKVLAKLLSRRLGIFAEEEILTEAQGGFRSERRCADQILILRGVCELRRKEKKGTYMAFLDVSEAYDTVWREGLWRKMQQYGVEEKFVRICRGLYKGIEASVVLEGEQSRWFPVETGLRQGCPLSPLLYSIYIMDMMKQLEEKGLGVKMDGIWCGGLMYADDIVLLAETGDELQGMLDVVGHYAQEWKFRFNARKSKTMVVGANSEESWSISGEKMEAVTAFKYLGVWLDQKMRGNVQMERMREKAEEWAGRTEWMSRVNGQIEVERGRLVWELLARPSLEHAASVWWTGGKVASKRLEAVQDRVGRRLLGASRSVAGVAVRGDLGWKKLEERREEKKMLYGRRVERLDDRRLVKMIMKKMRDYGSASWQGEYDVLLRKYGLEGRETGSAKEWKGRFHDKNCRDWMEEIEGKSSLKWYQLVKEEAGLEEYTRSLAGQEGIRLRFRLRTGSAGLFEDKKRCRMCDDERCVLCNSCEVEHVEHFLVRCEEFRWERQDLLDKIRQMEGTQEWIDEYGRVGDEGKMALLLGRNVKSLERKVSNRVDECVMEEVRKWWQRRKELVYGGSPHEPGPL